MTQSDSSLIESALAGSATGLEMLVRKYQAPVFALALERLADRGAAEEVAQDVLVSVSQKLHQLKDTARFGAWLRSITLRQCGMWIRSRRRDPVSVPLRDGTPDPRGGGGGGPHDEAGDDELGIAAVIARLPKGRRAAAALCLEDGLAPADAAAVLGVKPATLRKRLHDARATLQRRIVEKAEAKLELSLLPKDFARRCVCRCVKAREAQARKETSTMAGKKDCGCGCTGGSKKKTKSTTKTKSKAKK